MANARHVMEDGSKVTIYEDKDIWQLLLDMGGVEWAFWYHMRQRNMQGTEGKNDVERLKKICKKHGIKPSKNKKPKEERKEPTAQKKRMSPEQMKELEDEIWGYIAADEAIAFKDKYAEPALEHQKNVAYNALKDAEQSGDKTAAKKYRKEYGDILKKLKKEEK